jgi:cell division protein FtsI (penicillin-binding protein 3)
VEPGGTGTSARVANYRIAGKTGTAYIAEHHEYTNRYIASFVGIAPVSDPQVVVAVVIRNPKKAHYGGTVAAPAFSKIMSGTLRYLDVPPDK